LEQGFSFLAVDKPGSRFFGKCFRCLCVVDDL